MVPGLALILLAVAVFLGLLCLFLAWSPGQLG
jgi:hypothetical protein